MLHRMSTVIWITFPWGTGMSDWCFLNSDCANLATWTASPWENHTWAQWLEQKWQEQNRHGAPKEVT